MTGKSDDGTYGLDELVSNVHQELRYAQELIDQIDARWLMAHTLNVDPGRISVMARDQITRLQSETFCGLVDRRLSGEPISHIIGRRAFFGRDFVVDGDVLDPRPETETLIIVALSAPFRDVLDLGTGSGAVIVTLLAERQDVIGLATDISDAALAVAEKNAGNHAVLNRVAFEHSDWFTAVGGTYDLIVSNPPYIAAEEMAGLQREVLEFEPRIALTDEADGLTAYRKIVAGAPAHLTKGGRLILEIGPTQATPVCKMMENAGFDRVTVTPDLDDRDRVVSGYWPEDGPQPSA